RKAVGRGRPGPDAPDESLGPVPAQPGRQDARRLRVLQQPLRRPRPRLDRPLRLDLEPVLRRDQGTQSAMKMLVSPCFAAFLLDAKTSFFPSREKSGNPSKVSFDVTLSRPLPSSFIM